MYRRQVDLAEDEVELRVPRFEEADIGVPGREVAAVPALMQTKLDMNERGLH